MPLLCLLISFNLAELTCFSLFAGINNPVGPKVLGGQLHKRSDFGHVKNDPEMDLMPETLEFASLKRSVGLTNLAL